MIKVKDGYAKLIGTTYSGSADRVLLSNGGDKAVSDFAAASALSDYVTLATAQTITGVKTFTSSIYINSGKSIVDEGGHGVLGIKATTWSGVPSDGTAIGLGTLNNSLYFRSSSDNMYHYRSDKGVAYKVLDASNYSSYALPLNGGTMNLGEGLKFHSDSNYFGENSDARIISLLDGNGETCDGGLIIDERATYNGTEYITELLRIRHNEFKWKGNTIWHAGNLTKVSQLTNDSGYVTGGPYLPLSGGTITGKLIVDGILQSNSGIIRPSKTTPNAVSAITFYKGSKSTNFKRDAVIGWYNEGGTNSNGALYLVPYPQDIDPWAGVGLFISQTQLLFEGNTVYHSGNLTKSNIGLGSVQNTAFYKRYTYVNGTAWVMAGTTNSDTFTIYAPTTAGTSGQVLTSSGGTPSWTDQSSLSVGTAQIAKSFDHKSLPSSTSNATNTAWCKFARITYNAKAWCNANGYFIFSGGESTDHAGILSYHFRAGSTATTNSIAILEWLVKNRDTATVIAEKVDDNVYDLYINNYSSYTSPIIYHMTSQPERFTWSVGNWTTTKPTAAFTSKDSGRVNYATTSSSSSSSTIVGDGTVTLVPQKGNEINIGGTNATDIIFIGYRATGSKPIPSSFIFGGSSGTASITASKFIKSGGTSSQFLKADGGVATFNWSGQSGQPNWLWGGNDQHTYYVYNPANFNVNSAITSTVLLTNNTSQAADACYDESPGLRFWRFNGTGNDIGGVDGWIMSWSWNTGSVGGQIYLDDNPSKIMAIRGRNNDADKTFTSWSKFLHSTNYTEYTVKKDGTGASGTWGINITGSAGSATTASRLGLNGIADNTAYGTYAGIIQTSSGGPESGSWHNSLKILHNNSTGYYTQLAHNFTGSHGLWHRSNRAGTISRWYRLIDDQGGTIYGNLNLHQTADNTDSPKITFQRGVANNNSYYDWEQYVSAGHMYFTCNKNGSFATKVWFSDSGSVNATEFTGILSVTGNRYHTPDSRYGINMNNSDIIGANSIYFGDAVDGAGEGINFYRSSTTWDSLSAAGGVLYFSANRATATHTLTPVFSAMTNTSNQLDLTIGGQNRKLTIAYASNADTVDNLHSYAFKKTWEAHAGKTYIGWVTIAKWTVSTAHHFSPRPFMLSIYRSYNSPASEAYTFSITFGWDTAHITQVSGNAGSRIIEKLRIAKCSDNVTYRLDMYVNTGYTTYDNTCNCIAYGYYASNFSATTVCELSANVATTLAEVTTAGGVTASGNMYAAHFYENSDINLKKNIKAILDSDNIPVIKEFDWKSDGTHSYGLIAQELEEQGYSELVSDSGSHKTVNYSAALSLIVGKLQNKIKELEEEIENLKLRN